LAVGLDVGTGVGVKVSVGNGGSILTLDNRYVLSWN
jgi:hypothetical protein